MMDAVIDEVRGRRIRVGDHWLSDFASCNYLGFDLHPTIIESVADELRRWGTHPSWSRLLGSPRLYVDIEDELTALLGAPDTLLLPTISIIHTSVIPVLAGQGTVLVDAQAHKTIYEGCTVARGSGGHAPARTVGRSRGARGGAQVDPGHELPPLLHGRGQLHDGERPGPPRVRADLP